jgi:hypothetical protein
MWKVEARKTSRDNTVRTMGHVAVDSGCHALSLSRSFTIRNY